MVSGKRVVLVKVGTGSLLFGVLARFGGTLFLAQLKVLGRGDFDILAGPVEASTKAAGGRFAVTPHLSVTMQSTQEACVVSKLTCSDARCEGL